MKAATSALSVCLLAIGLGTGCNSPDAGAPQAIATSAPRPW